MWVRGYPIGCKLIVRCRAGHLFTAIWVPSASVKALQLGWVSAPSGAAPPGRSGGKALACQCFRKDL